MNDSDNMARLRERVEQALSRSSEVGRTLLGTLVDRSTVRVRNCEGYRADAIITCLEAVQRASKRNPLFARMSRALRQDGSVDLWLEDRHERWRAATFTMELHGTLDPSDYTLVLSTYVPFGYAGDRSSYPIERSTEYMRGTQTLRAVTSIQAKRIVQASSMFSDVDENAKSSVFADESTSRSTSSESSADVSTYRSNVSRGHEYARVPGTPGFFGIAERTTYTDRETSNVESGQESRIEHSIGSARERQHSEREQSERNVRTSATREQGSTIEVTQEVSFVAVGIDYTDADKLWEVWRRDPANRDVAIAVELMLSSFASLSGQIEDSNAARRRLGRDSATPALGNELTQRFWEQAAKLIPLDLDGSLWPRKILSHDGRPKAIGVQDIEAALRASRREIGSAAEIGRKLFE